MGHAGFYRRFIKDFSKIARPLCRLLEKDIRFNFDDACRVAFEEIKIKLVQAPIMAAPDWDQGFEIMCDASDFDGKAQLRQEKGGPKTLNRGCLTEEAKVWFYFLASVLVPTRHLSTVREHEAVMLYAILKGYKINIGTIIENSIMRYHEGNKRGVIPHPATVTILCLKAGVRGDWEAEEEVPLTSPLLLTGVSKGPRNQKKKGVLIKTGEETSAAREEEGNTEAPPDSHNFTFADTVGQDDRSPVDFSSRLASSPPMQGRTFREKGESSKGTQENQTIMEMLLSMQNKMEAREKEWRLQQEFREEVYEKELKRRDQEWEE